MAVPSKHATAYPVEVLSPDVDDGTMPGNVTTLHEQVVGHRIVAASRMSIKETEFEYVGGGSDYAIERRIALVLTLDDGRRVAVQDSSDCCAYTELNAFLINPEKVDHIITGVGTSDGYQRWHILADAGEIMQLDVNWSGGNLGYYSYGFNIKVSNVIEGDLAYDELEAGPNDRGLM